MKNFSEESWAGVLSADCPWQQDVADTKAMCDKLGIEFRSFNFEKEYADKVIEYFFAEYAAGRTPNPDVMCNKEIKFGLFLDKALELGYDYIATGHYARVRGNAPQPPLNIRGGVGELSLLKGLDPKKDQSYFLYTLTQDQLAHTLFPIGECQKAQVRQLAREFGLPNAEKKDSQGVCFVGHINLREFLRQRIPERAGEIVDPSGRVIGTHPGAWYYTVGQRRALGIGGTGPYYVAEKNVASNKLVAVQSRLSTGSSNIHSSGNNAYSSSEVEKLYTKTIVVSDIHWIVPAPQLPFSCAAKIRYQQPDQACSLFPSSPGEGRMPKAGEVEPLIRIEFTNTQFAPAPGQSVVFYSDSICLGGGIIID